MPLHHFLLVYDLNEQKLIRSDEYADSQAATTAYAALEQEYAGNRDVEIVLVGADSIDTIRRTHAHYFGEALQSAASKYLLGV